MSFLTRGSVGRCAVLGLLLGWLVACSVTAQPARPMLLSTERSEQLLEAGREALYDFRLPAAERIFRELAEQPDGAAAALHHLATVSLFKGMVTDNPDYFEEFFEHSDALKELLEDQEESLWRAQLYAETNLQRALVAGKTERYIRAALAGRSAYNGFENVINRAPPGFEEPYLGMGLLHLTVGSLPGGWRRLLRFLGFGGTVEGGLRELQRAARHSRFSRLPARILLALTDIVIHQDPEKGLRQLKRLHEENPESLLFRHLHGFALLMNRRAAEAEAVLRPAVRLHDDPDYFFINYVEFYLAEALFKQGKFAGAERFYRRYLARHRGPALKAPAQLNLGLALEMQGLRQEALLYYGRVEERRDFDSDAAASRAARALLQQPMTERERTLLKARNAYDAGQYSRAMGLLTSVLEDPGASANERAEAAYRRARVFHAQDLLEEAAQSYRWVIDHPGDPRAKWVPWSLFYLGEIQAQHGEAQAARRAYEAALEYDEPFDYHQSLEQATRAALERLDATQ